MAYYTYPMNQDFLQANIPGCMFLQENVASSSPHADATLAKRIENLNLWLTQNNPPHYIREAILKEILDCKYKLSLGTRKVPSINLNEVPIPDISLADIVWDNSPSPPTTTKKQPEFDGNRLSSPIKISLDGWQVEITCRKVR